jgi:proline iminopeptidase
MIIFFIFRISLFGQSNRTNNPLETHGAHQKTSVLKPGEFTATINGLKLWYKISGSGPVCLFPSPGWGCSSDLYFRTLTPLEEIFTMVYLDTRGSGRSEKPQKSIDYTYAHFTADLDGLRRHLRQDKVWMMGHSEGGVQALQYALAYPKNCQGLVLLDTYGADDDLYRHDVVQRAMERQKEPWFEYAMRADTTAIPKTDDAFAALLEVSRPLYFYDINNIAEYKEDFTAATISAAAGRGWIDSKRMGFNLLPRMNEIKLPTLIVVGNNDFVCSSMSAERIHFGITKSKLIVIDKAGHFPWMEQPEQFFTRVKQRLAALHVGE